MSRSRTPRQYFVENSVAATEFLGDRISCDTPAGHRKPTLQKHLGYFNPIFRLSELHQCDQEMLLGRFS